MRLIWFCIALFLYSCGEESAVSNTDVGIQMVDYNGLNTYLTQNDDKIRVVNFWATWCRPCIKELPHFARLKEVYQDQNIELIYVSLDFPNQVDSKLKPFVASHDMPGTLLYMTDTKANAWIPKVNKEWQGSIPATIIYKGDQRAFYEGSLTYAQLENELQQFL